MRSSTGRAVVLADRFSLYQVDTLWPRAFAVRSTACRWLTWSCAKLLTLTHAAAFRWVSSKLVQPGIALTAPPPPFEHAPDDVDQPVKQGFLLRSRRSLPSEDKKDNMICHVPECQMEELLD
jgi:hypothetical protein